MAAGETDKALGLKIFEHPGHNLPGTAKMVCNLLMGQCQVIGFFQADSSMRNAARRASIFLLSTCSNTHITSEKPDAISSLVYRAAGADCSIHSL